MTTRFGDVSVEERVRDATRAFTETIEPSPDAWLRLRTTIDERGVSPFYRRRRVVAIALATAVAVAVVVAGVIVIGRADTKKVSVPPVTGAPAPNPRVAVDQEVLLSPNTGLRDGQSIGVSGRNLVVAPLLITCRAGATPATWMGPLCDRSSMVRTTVPHRRSATNTAGSTRVQLVRYPYRALRLLNLPDDPVDCAAEPCIVLAVGPNDVGGSAPLHFDPNTAPLPTPTVTVTPTVDLQEGDHVSVHIENAWRGGDNNGANLYLCDSRSSLADLVCDGTDLGASSPSPIDSHGRATLTITVKSTVLASSCCTLDKAPSVTDCTQPPGCVIGVDIPAGPTRRRSQQAIPITFSTAVSARPLVDRLPQATIDPPGPYTDGQQVTVSATRVPKGTAVGQCATMSDADRQNLECAPDRVTETGSIVLRRFIGDAGVPTKQIDCAEPGRCALYLYNPPAEQPLPLFRYLEFTPLTVN